MNSFQVSVIIPVYNAVKYVRRAVESAVRLDEVKEVIIIDDGFPDGAIEVCRRLENEFSKVKLYFHEGHENKGAGASRNLGITKATCEFIAFLDADDWYLENRFAETKQIFDEHSWVDGVYVPVGTSLEEGEKTFFRQYKTKEEIESHISFPKRKIDPLKLFSSLLRGREGSFCTDGIVVKIDLLKRTGLFNESLRLHQDYELWLRCSYYGKLVPVNSLALCAMRAIHAENRIHKMDIKTRAKYYQEVCKFFLSRNLKINDRVFLIRESILYHPDRAYYNRGGLLKYLELGKLAAKTLAAQFAQSKASV
jgi:glycosyltransferase involved in cell wall biosynthesis